MMQTQTGSDGVYVAHVRAHAWAIWNVTSISSESVCHGRGEPFVFLVSENATANVGEASERNDGADGDVLWRRDRKSVM